MCKVKFYNKLLVKFTFDISYQRARLTLNSNWSVAFRLKWSHLFFYHLLYFQFQLKRLENFNLQVIQISRFLCDIPILLPKGVFVRWTSHIILKCPNETTQRIWYTCSVMSQKSSDLLVTRGFLITHNDAPQSVALLLDEWQFRHRDLYLTTHTTDISWNKF
jgi:hypothetical protein